MNEIKESWSINWSNSCIALWKADSRKLRRDLMEAVRVSERKKKRPKSTNRHGNVTLRGAVHIHGPLVFKSHRISQDALHCIMVGTLSLKPKHGVKGRLWSFWPTHGPPVHNGTGEILWLDLVDEDSSSILEDDADSDVSANAWFFHGRDNLVTAWLTLFDVGGGLTNSITVSLVPEKVMGNIFPFFTFHRYDFGEVWTTLCVHTNLWCTLESSVIAFPQLCGSILVAQWLQKLFLLMADISDCIFSLFINSLKHALM